ncbi:MAG: hypothetical protein ACPHQP_04665, partial [Longimicrobiales bacterium]
MSEHETMDDLSQVLRHRREKLDAIVEHGMQPFAYNFTPTASAASTIAAFEAAEASDALDENAHGERVVLGGRIVGWRDMGRSVFAHVEDGHGRVQL